MTRRAVIIGLGGTGQWVTTHVKKNLLEANHGELPDNVRILCFDTAPLMEKAVQVGAVRLDEVTEFIQVVGNVRQRSEQVVEGQHSHIGSWYRAAHWLKNAHPAIFNLSQGAGRIRQMGRMAVFHDLTEPQLSRIWSSLSAAFRDARVMRDVTDKWQLEVIVTGSFAGGTGAGMFIDIAHLVRACARKATQRNYIVRGFFVLPQAFPGCTAEMRARSFASWRELDRFLIINPNWGLRRMDYHATASDFKIDIRERAFDVCYLVNADRSVNPLTGYPEDGVFPAVADAISAILDTIAGERYTQWVTTNLNEKYVLNPGIPLHSSIGTYTMKVPVYYTQEEFSRGLALDVLDRWLAPAKEDDKIVKLDSARNLEKGLGVDGRREVESFLAADRIERGEESQDNSLLIRKIGYIVREGGADNEKLVEAHARVRLGQARSGIGEFLAAMVELGESTEAREVRAEVERTLRVKLQDRVPTSRQFKDTPAEAVKRFERRVPDFKREFFGVQPADGTWTTGKFGEVLALCGRFHVQRFRQLLRLWTLNTLMGVEVTEEAMIVARGGKLGYALDFYKELVRSFDEFLRFMNAVRERRQELNLQQEVEPKLVRAKEAMQRNASRKFLFFFTHPAAHRTQEFYLGTEQTWVNLRKDALLLVVVRELAEAMRETAVQARDEAQRWAAILALGDAPTGVRGLYREIADALAQVRSTYEADRKLSKVQKLFGEKRYETDEALIAKALSRLSWSVTLDKEKGVQLHCWLQQADGREVDLEKAGDVVRREFMSLTRSYFRMMPEEESIGQHLLAEYRRDGEKLAEDLREIGEPMWRPGGGPGPLDVSAFIRVAHTDDPDVRQMLQQTEAKLKEFYTAKGNLAQNTELVESDNPYKLTIVRSDDCVRSQDFAAWADCKNDYVQAIVGDRTRDEAQRLELARSQHCYPAEVNAVEYEFKIARMFKEEYRVLHPRVVMILEDKSKATQFFMALAFELISEERDRTGAKYWQLQFPGRDPLHLCRPKESLGDRLFNALGNYVLEGKDVREERKIRYERVEDAIQDQMEALGFKEAIKKLKWQKEDSAGIVAQLKGEVERLRDEVPEAGEIQVGQEYADLAALAMVMYDDEVRRRESVTSEPD